jgi:hypothetical protein
VIISHAEYEQIFTLRARSTSGLSMLEHNSDMHNRASGSFKVLHSPIDKLISRCGACSSIHPHTVDGKTMS